MFARQREAAAADQVVQRQRALVGQAPAPQRQLDAGPLHVGGIEADRHQHGVAEVGRGFRKNSTASLAAGRNSMPMMGAQRRVLGADPVQPGDLGHDVAGPVPVPGADLELLAVEILLLARCQRRALAQLEAVIDAEQPGQRRRRRGADQEGAALAGLQEGRVDVGRVDEEMRPEEVGRRLGGELGQIFGELRLAVAPGEVGVALAEPDLGQPSITLGRVNASARNTASG